VNVYR